MNGNDRILVAHPCGHAAIADRTRWRTKRRSGHTTFASGAVGDFVRGLVSDAHGDLGDAPRALEQFLQVIAYDIALRDGDFVRRAAECQRLKQVQILFRALAGEVDPLLRNLFHALGKNHVRLLNGAKTA
jgi:hypothetical protein